MIQTTLRDPKQQRTTTSRRPGPVDDRAWTAVDWLIVCAIFGCAVALARLVAQA